jgi:orotidine-5'-phosphate decarboxylase
VHLRNSEDPVFEFNKAIIDATSDLCVAYKPNLAFYESLGPAGWRSLEKTMEYIPNDLFTIADAKRGDIGNTSTMYANAFFSYFDFDAVTVAPYMGRDSVEPFLAFEGKWVILLGLTSNQGSHDFQQICSDKGEPLYAAVIKKAQQWGNPANLMFVVGATHPESLGKIRQLAPDSFFLVPGIGAQGGDLHAVFASGANDDIGLLVNSSRDIIFAGKGEDFAAMARTKALELIESMASLMTSHTSGSATQDLTHSP